MRGFYELSGSQLALVDKAEQIAREVIEPQAAISDRDAAYPRPSMKALGDAGMLGLTVPAAFGGLGASPRTFLAVVETIARSCASTAMVYVMHVCGTNVIAALPPRRNGEKILRDIAAGKHISTLAFSEKGSRSHFWAPVSKERREGGSSLLDADKSWVTSAGEADSYVVSTLAAGATTPVEHPKGTGYATWSTLYLVAKGAKGLTVPSKFDGLGMRGNASAPMTLRGVEVGEEDLVSAPGKGFDTMMGVVLPWFQIGAAAVAIGIAEGAFAATTGHLKTAKFEHMGELLSSLPNLRANVATMRMEIDRSRAQAAYTGRALENPGDHTMPAVLASKAQATEMALAVTDLAMRSCGGAAFSKQLTVERNFRDARAGSVMAPTTDVLKDFIGKASLGMPLF